MADNSSTNNIETLREHLFDTLKGLKDKSMDVDRAKAICDVSKQIIDTAKVEVGYLNVAGGKGSGFIPDGSPRLTGNNGAPVRAALPSGKQRQ